MAERVMTRDGEVAYPQIECPRCERARHYFHTGNLIALRRGVASGGCAGLATVMVRRWLRLDVRLEIENFKIEIRRLI